MQSAPIHPQFIRKLFSKPSRIEGSQFLRREIAGRMFEKLALVNLRASRVLDAGCGDGADALEIASHFPRAHIIGVDASEALLQAGLQKSRASQNWLSKITQSWKSKSLQAYVPNSLINGDFAKLSMKLNSVDVIWANLSLHWHPEPDTVFAEWHKVMRENGLVMFSCFGPDTCIELKQAFAEIDDASHVLPFVDMHDYGDMLVKSGFATPVMDMEKITLEYTDVKKLFEDVRSLGGNPLKTRRQSLLGKAAYQKVITSLESKRNAQGKIPLSFEVIYGHAFKPVQSRLAKGESIIKLDFPKKS